MKKEIAASNAHLLLYLWQEVGPITFNMHHNVFQGPRSFVIGINTYAESLMDPMHSENTRFVRVRPAGVSRQSTSMTSGKTGKDRQVPAQRAFEDTTRCCVVASLKWVYRDKTEGVCTAVHTQILWDLLVKSSYAWDISPWTKQIPVGCLPLPRPQNLHTLFVWK